MLNEFPGADAAEVLNAAPAALPGSAALDDIGYPAESDEPPLAPRREGLPPGFRMRHDKHYVEELMSTPTIGLSETYASSLRPTLSLADSAQDRRVAPPVRSNAAVMDLIAGRLGSIVAHNAVARPRAASPDLLARTMHAELERVYRLTRAVAHSAGQAEPIRRPVSAAEIVAALRGACARLTRLYGTACLVSADDPGFTVAIERALVIDCIAGTVDALLELAHGDSGDADVDESQRIAVSLQAVKVRPALIVDVECATLSWPSASADRFFDNAVEDFAAAPAAGTLLAWAAHVARLHGGRAEAQVQGGLRVRYVLPQEKPRAAGADA